MNCTRKRGVHKGMCKDWISVAGDDRFDYNKVCFTCQKVQPTLVKFNESQETK